MRTSIRNSRHQAGLSTIASVAALSGIMVLFLIIFLITNSGSKPPSSDNTNKADQQNNSGDEGPTSTTKEPSYIRIPANSFIYSNTTYGFSFAYPDSFEQLHEGTGGSTTVFSAESALADKKPVGNAGATLSGRLGAHVYEKDSFSIIVNEPNIFAGPTKTGNDITWKIVATDEPSNMSLGNPYDVKTIKSQTGITVFNFPLNSNSTLLGRLIVETSNHYVLIALPYVSRTDGATLSESDVAAYNVILTNIAKTVRVTTTTDSSSDSDDSTSN